MRRGCDETTQPVIKRRRVRPVIRRGLSRRDCQHHRTFGAWLSDETTAEVFYSAQTVMAGA